MIMLCQGMDRLSLFLAGRSDHSQMPGVLALQVPVENKLISPHDGNRACQASGSSDWSRVHSDQQANLNDGIWHKQLHPKHCPGYHSQQCGSARRRVTQAAWVLGHS